MTIIEALDNYYPLKKNLRVREVADFLDLSQSQIKFLCQTGILEAAKIGGVWRIPREALRNYLIESTNIYN